MIILRVRDVSVDKEELFKFWKSSALDLMISRNFYEGFFNVAKLGILQQFRSYL